MYTDKRAYNKQRTDAGKATGKSQEAPVSAGKTENPLNSFWLIAHQYLDSFQPAEQIYGLT